MLRRFITSLVLFGFIVSHLAAVPHGHGAASPDEQRRHNAHPHIHLGFGGHSYARNYERNAPLGLGDEQNGDEHDADAIYLPGAGAPALGNDRSHSARQCELAFKARLAPPSTCVANYAAITLIPWRPPDDYPSACPVFLKLRTIRI